MKRILFLLAAVASVANSTAPVFAADVAPRPSFFSRLDTGVRRRMYPRQQMIGGALGTGVLFALNRFLAKRAGKAERQHRADVARRKEIVAISAMMKMAESDADLAELAAIDAREASYKRWQKWRTRGKNASGIGALLAALFTGHGFLAHRERAGLMNGATPAWLAAPSHPDGVQLINRDEGRRALLLGVPSAQRAKAQNTLLGLEGDDDVLGRAQHLLQEAHRSDPDPNYNLLSAFDDNADEMSTTPFAGFIHARRQVEAGTLSLQNLFDRSRLQPSLGYVRSPLQQIYYNELLRRSREFATEKGLNPVAVQGVLGLYTEGGCLRMNQPSVVRAVEALKEEGVFPEDLISDSAVVGAKQILGMTLTGEQQVIAAQLAEADRKRAEEDRKVREEREREETEARARRAAAEAAHEEARQKRIDKLVDKYAGDIAALKLKGKFWQTPRNVVEKWLIAGHDRLSAPTPSCANADELRAGMEAFRVLAAEPAFAKTESALTESANEFERDLAGLAGRHDKVAALRTELASELSILGLTEFAELELLECLYDPDKGEVPGRSDFPKGYSADRAEVLRRLAARSGVDECDAGELRDLADWLDPSCCLDRMVARCEEIETKSIKALQALKKVLRKLAGQLDPDREEERFALLATIEEQITTHPDNTKK